MLSYFWKKNVKIYCQKFTQLSPLVPSPPEKTVTNFPTVNSLGGTQAWSDRAVT